MALKAELFVNLSPSLFQNMDKRLLIAQPIQGELKKFDDYYKNSIFCNNTNIQEVIKYTLKSDGKKIRPVLLLLTAKACGEINESTYNSAVTIELLHSASLIHDDVVDESKMRRGKPSLNAVYDNKVSVLAGDYFLSTALMKSVLSGNLDIITIISNLGRNLAEGELNQLFLAKEVILDENEYFEVIKKKTASLLSACMEIGAISTNGTEDDVEKFALLGDYLGICFQLRDDIFDYFDNNIGKPTGNDIREGKVTLPLLYSLKNNKKEESSKLLNILLQKDLTEQNISHLIAFAKENGGIEYTNKKINEYKEKALAIVNTFPENEIKKALLIAVDYMADRDY